MNCIVVHGRLCTKAVRGIAPRHVLRGTLFTKTASKESFILKIPVLFPSTP